MKNPKYLTVNLSSFRPTTADYELLEKGLSFIPTRKVLPLSMVMANQSRLIRSIKLRAYFHDESNAAESNKKTFTLTSNWVPPDDQLDSRTHDLVDKIKRCTNETLKPFQKIAQRDSPYEIDDPLFRLRDKNNLSKEEAQSLAKLRNDKNILIKPSDKGGATVIMNKTNYVSEAERQLNNDKYYRRLDKPIFTENIPKIKKILTDMLSREYITKKQFKYLSGPPEVRERIFYLLPKIHKKPETWPQPGTMPEGRPIVSDVNSETYRISEYIDSYINPLAVKHETYVKNTYDFVDKLKKFTLNDNCLLVTGDVTALYTNMHIDRSIDCVRKSFADNPNGARPDTHILELLEVSMRYNDFEFNGKHYLQIMGTAMGKRFAPALANLYLLDFDKTAKYNFRIKPLAFFRYLDDIFFLWPGDVNSLREYELFLNAIIPDIKVTLEHNNEAINFLDVTIYKHNNDLRTRIYFKPTDTHQLLHKSSFHPRHTFKGLLKSQFIRFKRLSSTKTDYDNTSKILCAFLKNRGYNHREMRDIKNDVWYNYREKSVVEMDDKTSLLPIITDYCSIGEQLGRNYRSLLTNKDNKLENIVVAYKNSKNLRQILVRSKLESDTMGAFRACTRATCKTCRIHAYDTTTINSTSYNKQISIHDNITCGSSNLVYLITCRRCRIQYVGETGRPLHDRVTDHRSAIKLKRNTPIGVHFNLPNHSALDLKVVGLELIKTKSADSEKLRKSREKSWQISLGTIFPKGLNGLAV